MHHDRSFLPTFPYRQRVPVNARPGPTRYNGQDMLHLFRSAPLAPQEVRFLNDNILVPVAGFLAHFEDPEIPVPTVLAVELKNEPAKSAMRDRVCHR
jgi:hypothetical protein